MDLKYLFDENEGNFRRENCVLMEITVHSCEYETWAQLKA